jgi:hypothetical protein
MVKIMTQRKHSNFVGKRKLGAEHLAVVIKMLGAWCTLQEVVDYLQEKYNINITASAVSNYRNTHAEEIKKAEQDFMSTIEALPIAHKVYRIKLRQNLIFDIMGDPSKDFANNKLWLEGSNAAGVMIRRRGNHGIVNNLLDSVQDELEPRRGAPTNPSGEQDSIREAAEAFAATMAKVTEIQENIRLTSAGWETDERPA